VPDKYGFNLLGAEVACIDCELRGMVWELPESVRAKHHADHARDQERAARQASRDRARAARKLARQKERENEIAYGSGDA
jgi:hypothetical protein